jgi:hypothetical protein
VEYLCDIKRHLICLPYSVANLHAMAADLGLKRGWFHNKPRRYHYDIPLGRKLEIEARCRLLPTRELLAIMTREYSD